MLNKFEKLVNRLIIEKVIEIVLVFSLLTISMMAWGSFNLGISASNITTLDEYKMNFTTSKIGEEDIIVAENPYHFNKNYQIYLSIKKDVKLDETTIIINDRSYTLNNFYCQIEKGEWKCLLINDEITSDKKSYYIDLKMNEKKENYRYIFEENNNF